MCKLASEMCEMVAILDVNVIAYSPSITNNYYGVGHAL